MAVSMAAVLSVPGQVVSGRRFTCSLTLTESGGTSTNLVSVQPGAYPPGLFGMPAGQGVATGVRFGTPANAATIGSYTGAANTINASSSITLNYDGVIDNPDAPNGGLAQGPAGYYLVATCQTSDGSVFTSNAILVTVNQPMTGAGTSSPAPNETTGASVILGTTRLQYTNVASPGQLRFDISANSNLIPFL